MGRSLFLVEYYTSIDIRFAWVRADDPAEAHAKMPRIREYCELIGISAQAEVTDLRLGDAAASDAVLGIDLSPLDVAEVWVPPVD